MTPDGIRGGQSHSDTETRDSAPVLLSILALFLLLLGILFAS